MIYDTSRMEPTLRQKMVEKYQKWVDEHVPVHTRAEYRELLHSNEAMAFTIFQQWVEIDKLRRAYRELQMEVARSVPMPPVIPIADFWRDISDHPDTVGVTVSWGMDPFRCDMKVMGGLSYDAGQFPFIAASIKRFFHEEYVPRLWKKTEATLVAAAR